MVDLISTIKESVNENCVQPFSVYSSIKEQSLLNVPIAKPTLIVVLAGNKTLKMEKELTCQAGDFVFLSSNPAIHMRNIPVDSEYFALLVEFDYEDFKALSFSAKNKKSHYVGQLNPPLEKCFQQFIEYSQWAPQDLWSLRKREILELLCHEGHTDILSMLGEQTLAHTLHEMFCEQGFQELSIETICQKLAMSESTLRRKLKLERISVQEIKDQARLGLGLHLLQTTGHAIGMIAELCGYQSQSRFTDRFKGRFGLTPSELRKTKMVE